MPPYRLVDTVRNRIGERGMMISMVAVMRQAVMVAVTIVSVMLLRGGRDISGRCTAATAWRCELLLEVAVVILIHIVVLLVGVAVVVITVAVAAAAAAEKTAGNYTVIQVVVILLAIVVVIVAAAIATTTVATVNIGK